MIALGEMRLHLVNDSTVLNDAGGAFGLVPRSLWRAYMTPDAENRIVMHHHVLVVEQGGHTIVIDAGYGDKVSDRMRAALTLERPNGGLWAALDRLGISFESVDTVILTHLHNDHCGGATRFGPDGAIVPTYPNARYFTGAREYHDATHPNERTRATYLADNYVPLYESGRLTLLDGDAPILPGVRVVSTPGHTPGHLSVILESAGETAMFVSDMASFAVHFERLAWMTAYDVEPLVTLETKRRWQAWALEVDPLLFFVHDSVRPVGRYRIGADGKAAVEAIPAAFA